VTNAAIAGVGGLSALGAISGSGRSLAAEPPPETTTVRLSKFPGICIAPQYIVGDLLRTEGFTEIRYVPLPAAYQTEQLERGEADFSLHFAAPTIMAIDAGKYCGTPAIIG
jgi:NitT/TauT family transport system substrate-binding protein